MDDHSPGATNYLQAWHERHAGATSAVLGTLVDGAGRNSYRVLADAMLDGGEPALDLACGDGYLLELMRSGSAYLGADRNVAELDAANRRLRHATPLVQADAARLPVATAALQSVSCHFALMLLQPLEDVLAELARVLRPDGLLAVMLPAVLTDAGFASLAIRSFSVSRHMTVDEATRALLLTYLPDLLPPAGFAQLEQALAPALTELAAEDGMVLFVEHADLVTARRC